MKTLRELFRKRKKPYERMETLNLNEIYVTRKEYNEILGEMLSHLAGISDLHEALCSFSETQRQFDIDVTDFADQQMETTQRLLSMIERIVSRIDWSDKEGTRETTLAEDLKKDTLSTIAKLGTPIHELGLSARSYNLLKALDINDVANLACQRRDALTACRNLGRKCLREMETALKSMGLHLGMDLSEYGYVQTDGILARATDIIHVKKNTVDAEL